MIHRQTHPNLDVPGCFGCRIASVGVSPSAMPSRHPDAVATNAREKRWMRDMPAYKEARRQGIQPARIDGCATRLQEAKTLVEAES